MAGGNNPGSNTIQQNIQPLMPGWGTSSSGTPIPGLGSWPQSNPQNAAGGAGAPPTMSGGAPQGPANPIAQPFGGPQIPGNPGSFWGPGSTYYGSQQGSSLPPEIINQQGNAYLFQNGAWTPGGVNARAPTNAAPPAPGYAGPNSIPGQQLNPYFGPQQQEALRAQLAPKLSGVTDPNQQRQILDNQLGKFFSGMAPTSDLGAPLGGYVPGYQVPQASLNYVPAGAEFGLEKQLLNRQPGQSLRSIIGNWSTGLGGQAGPAGFNVPTAQSQGGKGK